MDKILIEVYAPILGKSFDVFIPQECQMFEILELIKKAVSDMSDGIFAANESTALCNRSDGTILNINLSAYELGLHNGSKLILI
ncbi:MAG: methyltransferase [Acutalibacteraceae bacterium]